MYTTHGHQIEGTPVESPPPENVARCGGPSLCKLCSVQATRAKAQLKEQPKEEPKLETEQKDPNREVYMSISFHHIPVLLAEGLKAELLSLVPQGTTYAVYFNDALVVDEI